MYIKTSTTIKIPKGYRRLKQEEITAEGDLCNNWDWKEWVPLAIHYGKSVRFVEGTCESKIIIIRKKT